MKTKTILITLIALCATASVLPAQKVKVATVDINKLYNDYYKTQEAQAKFQVSVENAQEQINTMREEGRGLLDELAKLREEEESSALSLEKRNEIRTQIETKEEAIRQKDSDLKQFIRDSQQAINESRNSYNTLLLDEIKAAVDKRAQEKKATLVFDTSGRNSNSVPSIYYADPDWDITEDVLKILNKDAPAAE